MLTLSKRRCNLHFGEWLKSIRSEKRISQDELAKRTGRSKNYLYTLERNLPHHKTGALPNPSIGVLDDIAHGLGVPTQVVRDAWARYGGNTPPVIDTRPDENYSRLQSFFDGMTDDDRTELLQIAEMKWRKTGKESPNQTIQNRQSAMSEEDVPFDIIAIDLRSGVVFRGTEIPSQWKGGAITNRIVKNMIDRLLLLQSKEIVSIDDFINVIRAIDDSNLDPDEPAKIRENLPIRPFQQ